MADITMCQNKKCPVRNQCHRYTAPVTPQWQAYGSYFEPTGDSGCEFFWSNEGYGDKTDDDTQDK